MKRSRTQEFGSASAPRRGLAPNGGDARGDGLKHDTPGTGGWHPRRLSDARLRELHIGCGISPLLQCNRLKREPPAASYEKEFTASAGAGQRLTFARCCLLCGCTCITPLARSARRRAPAPPALARAGSWTPTLHRARTPGCGRRRRARSPGSPSQRRGPNRVPDPVQFRGGVRPRPATFRPFVVRAPRRPFASRIPRRRFHIADSISAVPRHPDEPRRRPGGGERVLSQRGDAAAGRGCGVWAQVVPLLGFTRTQSAAMFRGTPYISPNANAAAPVRFRRCSHAGKRRSAPPSQGAPCGRTRAEGSAGFRPRPR